MKILKPTNFKFSALLMLMVLLAVSAIAQTSIEIFNESDNTIILKFTSESKADSPNKVVLVYDSNMIALESTSNLAKKILYNNTVTTKNLEMLNSISVVDAEDEIEIEEWMLKPFTTQNNKAESTVDAEEEIPLEPWMTDLSMWN